jgi:hypothetical protein
MLLKLSCHFRLGKNWKITDILHKDLHALSMRIFSVKSLHMFLHEKQNEALIAFWLHWKETWFILQFCALNKYDSAETIK